MLIGICTLPVIPMRKTESDKSEMVNQILFGESFDIIKQTHKWSYVKLNHDNYYGWIDNKQYQIVPHHNIKFKVSNKKNTNILIKNIKQPLILGSLIPNNKKLRSLIELKENISYFNIDSFETCLIKTVKKYINTPYLWGGRTTLGIDCSGFTQIIFRLFNINLPRDSYQQAKLGKCIEKPIIGDLAFFEKESKINHVGIILKNNKIIHASGKVRIDYIDKYGIYDNEKDSYSHKLKVIKRLQPLTY
tara:strand:- start:285 stop:1025 length:741 start_codon:yes stop_codon:yes gene_type:complete